MIIGITGPIGSGKGVVTEYFVKKGFIHYSAREFLKKEAKRRMLTPDRDTLIQIGQELRVQYHPGYIIEQLYEDAKTHGKPAIIESIRSTAEIELLRKKGPFILIAITADQHIRYERILKRKLETDKISFGEFRRQEAKEAENTDPYKQNINACVKAADIILENNSSLEELYKKIKNKIVL